MQFQLKDKTILVTGGTSGVGRALTERLRHENRVIVLGRNPEKLQALASTCPNVETIEADLANLNAVRSAIHNIRDMGALDVLINNAAIQHTPLFTDPVFDPNSITEEISVNFTSICHLIHGLLPCLEAAGNARIININSALGLVPKTSSAVYCATKGALNILTQSLRYQLEGAGIQVQQAILPLVDTAMTTGRGSGKISAQDAAQAIIRGLEKDVPDNRVGKVKLLMILHRISPALAARILKGA
ncbi:SDR family oxidoreductase [Kordiimonas lacus]|uniref:Uncharacterized oxidoreductase n=1 Tax=Kordiimonas lacus TaxID=637679 RepID=A0A1G7E3F9_9PROT|nr:SDR family NAD(P)-dependent oxidoreductase [Kordiimonas lacus]SDE58254.1 uncharacterized oxidoreductase [Kordiimonas lacus]